MKTIFTLLLSSLVSVTLLAADARPVSTLMIRSADGGDLRVVIDGRRFESKENTMRIRGIAAGNHSLKIYRQRNTGRFNISGNRYEMVYSQSIRIKPNTDVMIGIDRNGRTTVRERRNNNNGWNNGGRNDRNGDIFGDRDRYPGDRDFDDNNWDRNRDFDFERGTNSGDYGERDRDRRWRNDDRDIRDGRIDDYGNSGFNRAMSDHEFNMVMQSMRNEWLENNKAKSASQIISTNYLTTMQVRQMLQLFSFENLKLDLAKQAYVKTVDQRNYHQLNDVFSFASSREELTRFIRNYR